MATEKVYKIEGRTASTLERAFMMQPVNESQAMRLEQIRNRIESTARYLCTLTPDCPDQQEMIRTLRLCEIWAREAIMKTEIGGR